MRKTTEQTAMGFVRLAQADAATEQLLGQLYEGINLDLGRADAGRILKVQESVLSETRAGKKHKRQFQLRWYPRLLVSFPEERQVAIVRAQAELVGLDVVVPRKLTDAEYARELELALLSFGEQGRQKLEKVPR